MKITVVLCMLSIFCASAEKTYSQVAEISLNLRNVTVAHVLDEIKQQSDFSFWYKNDEIKLDEKISIQANKQNIDQVLHALLDKQGLSYSIDDNHIIIYKNAITSINQQSRKITGIVTDEKNEPIIGANVVVKGSTIGNITDIDGRFVLEVSDRDLLVVSYIGFITKEVPVGKQNSIKVQLSEDTQKIDEVVVIGYGSVKKVI